MNVGHKLVVATAVLISVCAGAVQAAPLTQLANDNATVRPAGPRTGSSGKAFFNIEGSANGVNASYGVADFNFGVLGQVVANVNSVQLALTEANAAFTTAGPMLISLDQSATLADIQPVTSPLIFDGSDPGTATDVTQLDLSLLDFGGGPFAWTTTGNINTGTIDTYPLGLNPALEAEITNRLNTGRTIRVVIGTGAATLAATCAGYTHSTLPGPTLILDVTYANPTSANASTWGRLKALYR